MPAGRYILFLFVFVVFSIAIFLDILGSETTLAQTDHEDAAFTIWYQTLEVEHTCLYETPTMPRYTIKTCAKPAYFPYLKASS